MRSLRERGLRRRRRPPTGMAGSARWPSTRRPDLVILDLGPARRRRHPGALHAAGGQRRAGDRRQRPRRRPVPGQRPRRRRRRLRRQALHDHPARGADPGGDAALRRPPATARRNLVVGGLEIDVAARRGRPSTATELDLSPREFDLLAYLAERPGEVVTKRELLTDVWHQAWGGSDKTVDVHLSWLRRKLGESAPEPRYLPTRARGRRTPDRADVTGLGDAGVRRSLILTVAATVTDGAAGDAGADGGPPPRATRSRTGSRAPRSRCRPPRRWCPGRTRAPCRVYLDRVNRGRRHPDHGALPRRHQRSGRNPGEDERVARGPPDRPGPRRRRRRRRPDPGAGVARRQQHRPPSNTPVILVECTTRGLGSGHPPRLGRSSPLSALVLLARRAGAGRPARAARSWCRSARARHLRPDSSATAPDPSQSWPTGRPRCRELDHRPEPAGRPDRGAARARAPGRRRPLAPAAYADHRAAAAASTVSPTRPSGPGSPTTSTSCTAWSTTWCSEARRSEREGLVARVRRGRGARRAGPLLGSRWPRTRAASFALRRCPPPSRVAGAHQRAATWSAMLDVLLDNVFTHTPEGSADRGHPGRPRRRRGWCSPSTTAGPASPRASTSWTAAPAGAAPPGLGLAIVARTATESGGGLALEPFPVRRVPASWWSSALPAER